MLQEKKSYYAIVTGPNGENPTDNLLQLDYYYCIGPFQSKRDAKDSATDVLKDLHSDFELVFNKFKIIILKEDDIYDAVPVIEFQIGYGS